MDKHMQRVAFQITVNGKPYCESEDITVLTMVAEEIRRRDGHRISLHASAGETQVQWLSANLTVGDEVIVRIVDAAGVDNAGALGCGFCGHEVNDVENLVQGPSVAICDRCIASLSGAVKNANPLPVGASMRDEPEWACGFCANQPGTIPGVVVRNGAAVCPECLRACVDILAESPGK
jgi:hypothetical protein